MNTRTAVLQYIEDFKKGHLNRSPSYREIVAAGVCSSTSQVHHHMNRLVMEGLLRRDGNHLEVAKRPRSPGVGSLPRA